MKIQGKEVLNLSEGIKRKLQRTPKDQFTLTIPKTLVKILNWKDKEEISFDFVDGELVLETEGKK